MIAYIDAHRDRFGVEPICRVLEFAPSTYWSAKRRPASARSLRDEELKVLIARVQQTAVLKTRASVLCSCQLDRYRGSIQLFLNPPNTFIVRTCGELDGATVFAIGELSRIDSVDRERTWPRTCKPPIEWQAVKNDPGGPFVRD